MPPPRSLRPLSGLRPNPLAASLHHRPLLCLRGLEPLDPGARPGAARTATAATAPRRSYVSPTNPPPTTTPTTPTAPALESSIDARRELEATLHDLKKHAGSYVNLSRLHLALLGLGQPAGQESIRVAVLGVANEGDASGTATTAKAVLQLLLADPLKDAEEWETQLAARRPGFPVIVKVGRKRDGPDTGVVMERRGMFEEVHVSSPVYDSYNLEILLMDVNPPSSQEDVSIEEQLLDLPVDIPSNTGKFSPIMTPVHKALVVADGFASLRSLASVPANDETSVIYSAVNIPGYHPPEGTSLPFQPIDVATARQGVDLIRQDIRNAMDYERAWFSSNLPALAAWLKTGIAQQPGTTKPVVLSLVSSVLQETAAAIQAAESRRFAGKLTVATQSPSALARWKKLGWWKLFWRVDDVTMLTNDMLNQQFLPSAEKNLVPLVPPTRTLLPATVPPQRETRWPTHISFTRRYLQEETIPALQALAQKLVLQCYATCGLTASLSGLLYVSAGVSSLYEAGAVAALGVVWSLRRLQKKWEAARGFWEGEVREEGRKAVRGAEESIAQAVEGGSGAGTLAGEGEAELERVRELVAKAEEALARLK
ncbi:unnamed protein product [Parascedosporium putredinis]|uniref:Mmc1 C-terminal domain-containing protein n=1 Tax=Parascedosporium putredinis TaxID=1442378 RepID=A0A9P1M7C8_9PEZI|nr:unnamed protein product [Parascedosporium putredinis]CAI7987568.1 unnamed protein product [Parascedosporium putredinis]